MERIVECVPNFSEGRDKGIIDAIAGAIAEVDGVKVLHVDMGAAAHRTVITFAGVPDGVCEAAFRAVKTASELIDMRVHHGEHPRIGATDVLPIVPVAGVSLEECAEMARALSKRIYEELSIPVYCYEAAAFKAEHHNLEDCRKGEYEALPEKIVSEKLMPDFGGGVMTKQAARSGASVVGARNFLIAVNFNLDTKDVDKANAIACDVRARGHAKRLGDPYKGKIVRDVDGRAVMVPGTLRAVKAIGWYIEEYGIAQVSMNITDITQTALHVAYEEVCRKAEKHGCRVTGTEIIGLVPKCMLVDAGRYFAAKEGAVLDSEHELVALAVERMNLSDLAPFEPKKRVIEYLLGLS